MEKKNSFYSSDCHCYTLDGFEHIKTLDEAETKVALRTLKYHLDNEMGFEMSDELFEDIFRKIPYLRPLHPFVAGGRPLLGYIQPLKNILKKHHINE